MLSKLRVRLRSCFRSAVASLHGTGARRVSRVIKRIIEMQTKNELWILTTVDDRQTLGEKAVVSIYRKFSSAKRALLTDLKEVMARRELVDSDIEKDWDAMYVQTHDKLNCWFIESQEV